MTLYLDNYKGFIETFIPIKEVTFLVGENSTGKTSILQLLELVSQPQFWFKPSFNNRDIELGYFSEIVSQISGKKDYFAIGILYEGNKTSNAYDNYLWMKFTDQKSSPELSEFRFIVGDISIWCSIKKGMVSFRTKIIQERISFEDWIKDIDGYEEHETELKDNYPFVVLCSRIAEEVNKDYQIKFPELELNLFWIAPIRAKAKRWYESYKLDYSSEGDHTPILLKRAYSRKSTKSKSLISALDKFGKDSGLFDSLVVKNGKSEDSPFSLFVKYGKLSVNIANVGYGVSQVLPLAVELLSSSNDSFAIQQPEVHLHPKAQAAFGELLHTVATVQKNRIIVESHSDYMINRFRYATAKSKKKVSAQILFCEKDDKGTHVKQIPINAKGQFEGDAIDDYMRFFFDEEMKILEI